MTILPNLSINCQMGEHVCDGIANDKRCACSCHGLLISGQPELLVQLIIDLRTELLGVYDSMDQISAMLKVKPFERSEVLLERVQRVAGEAGPQDVRGGAASTRGSQDAQEASDDSPF